LRGVEGLRHEVGHRVEIERIVGDVVRPRLHRFDRRVDGGIGRQQDDDDVGMVVLDPSKHGHAVDVGHLVVQQHEIDPLVHLVDGVLPRGRFDDAQPVRL